MYCKKIGRDCKYYKLCNSNDKLRIQHSLFKKINFNFIHKALFNAGIKPIIKYEFCTTEDNNNLDFHSGLNFKYHKGMYSFIEEESFNQEYCNDENYINIIIGYSKKVLKKFIYYNNHDDFVKRVSGTGLLLGYPECCIKNAIHNGSSLSKLREYENWEINVFREGVICPLLSNIIKLYVHYPCGSKCKKTIENSEKVMDYLVKEFGDVFLMSYFGIHKKNNNEI